MPNPNRRARSRRAFAGVSERPPAASLSARQARTKLGTLSFASDEALLSSLDSKRVKAGQVAPLLTEALKQSESQSVKLARSVIRRRRTSERANRDELRALVHWGRGSARGRTQRRKVVCKAFKESGRNLVLVHGIAELPGNDAKAYMKSYFQEGGDMAAVAEWLAIAGSHLRTQVKRPGTDGFVSDAANAVGDLVSDAADAAGDLVSNVVDAVVSAGKSIGEAVSEAAGWTVSKITDLVKALAAAGKSVASILTEAAKKGAATLKKFVEAAIRAGRSVGEVLKWAVAKTASTLKNVVSAILAAGRKISDVLSWAAAQAASTLKKVLGAIVALGKSVSAILSEAVRLATSLLKKVVTQLFKVIGDIGDILVAAINLSASVIRTVLEGLFAAGLNLAKVVAAVCQDVAEGFRKGFFEGLIALGKGALDILKAAAATGLSMVALAFAVLLEIWGGHRRLTAEERRQAELVFGSSIDLDRVKIAVASIPSDVINWLNGQRPFTTMYVINFASWRHVDMRTLIHELTHVWQGVVAGPVYMVEALHSQFFGRGYSVTDADITAANGDLTKLEREQQAVVVEDYWAGRWGGFSGIDWQRLEPLARDVYKPLRSRTRRSSTVVPVFRRVTPRIRIPLHP